MFAPSARRRFTIFNAGAKRTSSVSGLKAKPQTASVFAAQNPEFLLYLGYELLRTSKVYFLHLLQQREVAPKLFPDADESLKILGKANPPKPMPDLRKLLADAAVAAYALGYFGDIGASGLTSIPRLN